MHLFLIHSNEIPPISLRHLNRVWKKSMSEHMSVTMCVCVTF